MEYLLKWELEGIGLISDELQFIGIFSEINPIPSNSHFSKYSICSGQNNCIQWKQVFDNSVSAIDTKYSGITCGTLSFLKQQAVQYFVKIVRCHSERSEEANGISGLQERFFG